MKPGKRIDRLRDAGYQVHVTHGRLVADADDDQWVTKSEAKEHSLPIAAKGGVTQVVIIPPPSISQPKVIGYAECSKVDNFSRERGLQIALGRALKQLKPYPKEDPWP